MVSCHEPLQNTQMLWVKHHRVVIQCDTYCHGIWFPALAPYIIQASGIKKSAGLRGFHARNWMLMHPAWLHSAQHWGWLCIEISFRWYCLFFNSSFRLKARSGYNPLLSWDVLCDSGLSSTESWSSLERDKKNNQGHAKLAPCPHHSANRAFGQL